MWFQAAKRAIDVAGAAALLVLSAPLMLCTALAIYLTMGRPVLFCQQRAGYRGRPFTLYKFRTMREAYGPGGKPLADGERLTRLGRLLRWLSLDELPQLWNVLAGTMSLVGPRPLLLRYLDRYTPEQARRHDVKPGLTGWAQIHGRNALDWEEKFRLDVWYADHAGLWLDVRILAKTAWKVFQREGVSHAGSDTMPEFLGTPAPAIAVSLMKVSAPVTALQPADRACLVPRLDSPQYVPALAEILRREQVDVVLPLVDPDIPMLAAHRQTLFGADRSLERCCVVGTTQAEPRLAVDGGSPVRREPLPPWPAFGEEELEAVVTVLRSGKVNYWTGRQGRLFEEEFARLVGCRHAVAVANGTVALELALHALGIGPGDEVIVPARSFVASASCCETRGARAVFADVDPDSQNLTAETIRAVLSPRTKAIIAVHLAGWPCEMDPILELAGRHGLHVIEDCAQAQGAAYRGRPVGSLGHAAAFSFCQDKIMTTGGEGGMMTTNCREVWRKAWSYKDHGKDWDEVQRPNPDHVFQWLHATVGTNWRLTEMQSALGRAALRKLPGWLAARRANAAFLYERLSRLPAVRIPVPPGHVEHAFYKQYLFLRAELLGPGWSRDRIVRAVQAEGITCGSGTCPEIYLEGAFAGRDHHGEKRLPNARRLGQTSLMLQVHPTLKRRDVADICLAVEKVLAAATMPSESGQVLPLSGVLPPIQTSKLRQVA